MGYQFFIVIEVLAIKKYNVKISSTLPIALGQFNVIQNKCQCRVPLMRTGKFRGVRGSGKSFALLA